tara:strand:+ start:271 stop:666 length:396 start_codon:yes stop_codon:yes gene_type:complete
MASELKVDKFTGVTTAGSILVTGEGNSTTTNLQQGLAKAWVKTVEGASPADSFNISGVTDVSTGNYLIAINNDISNAHYSVVVSKLAAGSARDVNLSSDTPPTASAFQIFSTAASSTEDQTCYATVHGDLA